MGKRAGVLSGFAKGLDRAEENITTARKKTGLSELDKVNLQIKQFDLLQKLDPESLFSRLKEAQITQAEGAADRELLKRINETEGRILQYRNLLLSLQREIRATDAYNQGLLDDADKKVLDATDRLTDAEDRLREIREGQEADIEKVVTRTIEQRKELKTLEGDTVSSFETSMKNLIAPRIAELTTRAQKTYTKKELNDLKRQGILPFNVSEYDRVWSEQLKTIYDMQEPKHPGIGSDILHLRPDPKEITLWDEAIKKAKQAIALEFFRTITSANPNAKLAEPKLEFFTLPRDGDRRYPWEKGFVKFPEKDPTRDRSLPPRATTPKLDALPATGRPGFGPEELKIGGEVIEKPTPVERTPVEAAAVKAMEDTPEQERERKFYILSQMPQFKESVNWNNIAELFGFTPETPMREEASDHMINEYNQLPEPLKWYEYMEDRDNILSAGMDTERIEVAIGLTAPMMERVEATLVTLDSLERMPEKEAITDYMLRRDTLKVARQDVALIETELLGYPLTDVGIKAMKKYINRNETWIDFLNSHQESFGGNSLKIAAYRKVWNSLTGE